MEQAKNYMHLELLAKAENVSLARLAVASFAAQLDFTLAEIEEIKVVISETVSNAVIHGYQNEIGLVGIEVKIYFDKMEIIITDQGQGINDIDLARQPAYTTDPERMGLGLSFVDSFMDELKIISAPQQGTKIIMVKYLHDET